MNGKNARQHIKQTEDAIDYLERLGIEEPTMEQVELYHRYQQWTPTRTDAHKRVHRKAELMVDLGLKDKAERLLTQYHRIRTGKELTKQQIERFSDLWYRVTRQYHEPPPFIAFTTLGTEVEEMVRNTGGAALKAYHLTGEEEFGNETVSRATEEKKYTPEYYVPASGQYRRIWKPGETTITTHQYTLHVREARDILQALYRLHLREPPERLAYLKEGVTKRNWKQAHSVVRAIENGHERAKKYTPQHTQHTRVEQEPS